MPSPYSVDLRERVVAACEEGVLPRSEIARQFRIAESTLYEWLKIKRETGSLDARPHAGGPVSELDPAVLTQIVQAENDGTLAEYAASYAEWTGRLYSSSRICRALKALRLPRKRKTLRASEQLKAEIAAEREAFWIEIRRIPVEDLIFLDEAGITTNMVRAYARAARGKRALSRAPAGRYERLTLLGAITLTGLQAMMTIPAFTDAPVFHAFVKEVLVPVLRPGQVVVMDNLPAHKRPEIQTLIEGAGCRVLFLPRYSPEWNPIEMCWSKMKNFLRSLGARTLEALEAAVKAAMDIITDQDARGWFQHCGYP